MGITTIKLIKQGTFFYREDTGEQYLMFPENFHLSDGVYYANISGEERYGDKVFHICCRLQKSSL
jgi:hypothetical protein